jgi:SSS family solute:Na+ symporter
MNAIYFIPIFAVVVVGMLHPRVPSTAAFLALLLGLVMIGTKYFIPGVAPFVDGIFRYNFHFLGFVFATLVIFMIVWAAFDPRPEPWKLETSTPIDMTPWKNAKWASLILITLVILIYAGFASFRA